MRAIRRKLKRELKKERRSSMHLQKRISIAVPLVLMLLLTGCSLLRSSEVHLHPITGEDFYVRDDEGHEDDICFTEWYYKHKLMPAIDPSITYKEDE
jgi:hypothetical protein